MKIPELQKDILIQDWLNTSGNATASTYLLGIQHYTEWIQKTPTELIDEAEAEAFLIMRKRKIKMYLTNFKMFLMEKKLAPLTVKSYLTSVKSFYRFYDIELPNLPKNKTTTLQKNNKIPDKNDLQEVLKICDPLERAIVLVGASSGLGASEIISLKISDFKNGYNPQTGITTLKLRRHKTDVDFVTFLTPEASKAVLDYLEFRSRSVKTGEIKRQTQLEKQKILSDENYLFCTRRVPNSYLENKDDELRKFNHYALMDLYRRLSEKAQKNTPKNDFNLIRSHNLRKWFNSTLLNAGCDFFHCEEFMGHHLPATQEHYFRANSEGLMKYYAKFIPFLTIEKSLDITDSPDFKRVIEENEVLRAERLELEELREKINKIEENKKIIMKNIESILEESNYPH